MVIGITGGSGAGKSTVSAEFEKHGFKIADADKIAHMLMVPGTGCFCETLKYFGREFLNTDGTLNRKKLGEVVFSNAEKLSALNKITHKYITAEIKKITEENRNTVIDAAVLFESGADDLCDATVYVHCPEEIRIKRIMERDGISEEYAKIRIHSQAQENEYKGKCDYTVLCDGKTDITKQIEEILNCLRKY